EDFQEIHSIEYGLDDTRFFSFVADSSGQRCGVDVRLLEFQIRPISETVQFLRGMALMLAVLGAGGAGGLLWWHVVRHKLPRPETSMPHHETHEAQGKPARPEATVSHNETHEAQGKPAPPDSTLTHDEAQGMQSAAVAHTDLLAMPCPSCQKR